MNAVFYWILIQNNFSYLLYVIIFIIIIIIIIINILLYLYRYAYIIIYLFKFKMLQKNSLISYVSNFHIIGKFNDKLQNIVKFIIIMM